MREEQDITNGGGVGEEHDKAVDANALAGGGGHAMFQGADIIGVEVHGLLVAGILFLHLLAEALRLVLGVVQLGEAVG